MVKRKTPLPSPRAIFASLSPRLAGNLSSFFVGQEDNVKYLLEMLNRTVDKGESNSLLVLGPRGVGKTALVNHVLEEASNKSSWKENVVVVQLSGHIQTDDKVALRDITKQLNLENVVGDKVFGSFAEHLSFLLASLKTGDSTSKPIIFILDQFDSFCSHKNQTLLYNLFDVDQSKAVPITVVGISSSIDVTELLEKRVKSRFSHRHLYIWPMDKLDNFMNMMTDLLTLDTEEFTSWNKSVKEFVAKKNIQKFVEQKVYSVDNSIRNLKKFLYQALVKMVQSGNSQLELEHLQFALECSNNSEVNSITNQLRDLSITELCLLIAIKHIEHIYDNEPFNFEMVYHEFVKFKRRKYSTLPDERSVVSKCWENLLELELVSPRGSCRSQGGIQEQFSLHTGQVPPAVLSQAVEKYPNCPTEVLQWLSSSHHTASH